jgi:transcriptional regulator with XRE-family HTH domain
MTKLKTLIAHGMKERRRVLGVSQVVLAEKVKTSTNYIAMIELEKKSPSLEMVEKIAIALEIEPAELFSMQNIVPEAIKKLKVDILGEINSAISRVICDHLSQAQNQP